MHSVGSSLMSCPSGGLQLSSAAHFVSLSHFKWAKAPIGGAQRRHASRFSPHKRCHLRISRPASAAATSGDHQESGPPPASTSDSRSAPSWPGWARGVAVGAILAGSAVAAAANPPAARASGWVAGSGPQPAASAGGSKASWKDTGIDLAAAAAATEDEIKESTIDVVDIEEVTADTRVGVNRYSSDRSQKAYKRMMRTCFFQQRLSS
jgi:hypothetical protein